MDKNTQKTSRVPPVSHHGEINKRVVLFDGECVLCNRTVDWLLRHDHQERLRFASLQGDIAGELRQRYPQLQNVDTVVFVYEFGSKRETVLLRSDAILALARELGWPWRLLATARLMPRTLRDKAYDALAARRFRWFGRQLCRLPAAGEAHRFLP